MTQHIRPCAPAKWFFIAFLFYGAVCSLVSVSHASSFLSNQIPSDNLGHIQLVSDQSQILDLALSSLRARKKEDVFQFLSVNQKNTFPDGPKGFMQFVRTHLHAIYDHTTYRILNQFMPSPGVIVHKVEFLDREGHGTIGLVKMIKDETQNDTWRIDHFAVLYSESERDI